MEIAYLRPGKYEFGFLQNNCSSETSALSPFHIFNIFLIVVALVSIFWIIFSLIEIIFYKKNIKFNSIYKKRIKWGIVGLGLVLLVCAALKILEMVTGISILGFEHPYNCL